MVKVGWLEISKLSEATNTAEKTACLNRKKALNPSRKRDPVNDAVTSLSLFLPAFKRCRAL